MYILNLIIMCYGTCLFYYITVYIQYCKAHNAFYRRLNVLMSPILVVVIILNVYQVNIGTAY